LASAVTVTKVARGDFGWVFRLLSALMSTLAIVALARHAFVTWSLSAPMTLVMDAYHATMQLLLGWAQPYLQATLTWLGSFIGWRPILYTHWRDVLVVTLLFAAGIIRAVDRAYLLVVTIIMVGAALGASLVAGLLPLDSSNLAVQLLIAASFGLVMLVILVVIRLLRGIIRVEPFMGVIVLFAVVPALLTWLLSLALDMVVGMGLAGLAVSVGLLAAASPAVDYFTRDGEVDPTTWLGARIILGGYAGAVLFFGIDAGLKLLMG
jgi:hypothetical protein